MFDRQYWAQISKMGERLCELSLDPKFNLEKKFSEYHPKILKDILEYAEKYQLSPAFSALNQEQEMTANCFGIDKTKALEMMLDIGKMHTFSEVKLYLKQAGCKNFLEKALQENIEALLQSCQKIAGPTGVDGLRKLEQFLIRLKAYIENSEKVANKKENIQP